jgi:hypothetical protein
MKSMLCNVARRSFHRFARVPKVHACCPTEYIGERRVGGDLPAAPVLDEPVDDAQVAFEQVLQIALARVKANVALGQRVEGERGTRHAR